jgi:hypothetical protein
MAGLVVPAIHVLLVLRRMPGTRLKAGHEGDF